jgi:hypothetical protein
VAELDETKPRHHNFPEFPLLPEELAMPTATTTASSSTTANSFDPAAFVIPKFSLCLGGEAATSPVSNAPVGQQAQGSSKTPAKGVQKQLVLFFYFFLS